MISIGIDPASKKAGIAILNDDRLIDFKELDYKTAGTSQGFATELNRFYNEVQAACVRYNPDIVVIEHTSVNNNLNTTKVLSYFEGAALAACGNTQTTVERVRTTSARKRVLGKGNIKKPEAVHWINEKYDQIFPEDVAEAILFALCGPSLLEEKNG